MTEQEGYDKEGSYDKLPWRLEHFCSGNWVYSSVFARYSVIFRQRSTILIAIKPERILEPFVERCSVGGMSLTLSVVHAVVPGGFFDGGSDQLFFPAFVLFCTSDWKKHSFLATAFPTKILLCYCRAQLFQTKPPYVLQSICIYQMPSVVDLPTNPSLQNCMRPTSLQILLCNPLAQRSNHSKYLLIMIPQPRLGIRIRCPQPGNITIMLCMSHWRCRLNICVRSIGRIRETIRPHISLQYQFWQVPWCLCEIGL